MNAKRRNGNSPLNIKSNTDEKFSLSRIGGDHFYQHDVMNS